MIPAQFDNQVRSALERVTELQLRAQLLPSGDTSPVLVEALEELTTAFAELDTATEELRVQNEALAAAEATAVAERDRYRELFEFAPHGYLITDPEGVIHESNRAARDLLNVGGPRYVLNKPLWVFVAAADRAAFLAALTGLQQGRPNWSLLLRLQPRPEGSPPRVADVSVVPYRDPDTRTAMLRWQFRDVTNEVRAAEEAKRLDAELARRQVEAERQRDELVGVLAHELRNPLTPLLGAAQVVRERAGGDPELDRSAGVIDRQVGRLLRLIDDMMEVARLSLGKVRLRAERVDLGAAASAAADAVRAKAEGRGLRVTADAPAGPVWVDADPGRLEQVLSNLLDNAVKYTEAPGTVAVSVGVDGSEAVVRVADTGVGIPADVLPHVFELFAQSDSTAGRSQGGLGVGLAVVRQVVQLHGGTVACHSDGPGCGSEFVVRLPLYARQDGGGGEAG